MRKVWTTLIIFSLFFLFSFSSAATVTINIIEPDGTERVISEDNEEITSDVVYTLDLQEKAKNHPIGSTYYPIGYEYLIYYMDGQYYYMFYDSSYFGVISTVHRTGNYYVTFIGAINSENVIQYLIQGKVTPAGTISGTFSDWVPYWKSYSPRLVTSSTDVYEFIVTEYSATSQKVGTLGEVIEPSIGYTDKIVMENPLSDAEVKSILEIFLESVRNSDLPEHYGRYFLVYNKNTDSYSGYVYPSYVDLDIRYYSYDDEGMLNLVNGTLGEFYSISVYQEDESFFGLLFDSVSGLFRKRNLYEFKSNSSNTYFYFNDTLSLDEDFIKFHILSEPIVYTSHHIYSLIYSENDSGLPEFNIDETTSIDKQEFIINSETGEVLDTTINEYTEEVNSDVNILSFIKLLFEFIFSLVSFLIRFFTFIVTFIMVPASTAILPAEFVQGIDWIHSFAFGEILLWDIFSILFAVLLSLYIVKLIRSH